MAVRHDAMTSNKLQRLTCKMVAYGIDVRVVQEN